MSTTDLLKSLLMLLLMLQSCVRGGFDPATKGDAGPPIDGVADGRADAWSDALAPDQAGDAAPDDDAGLQCQGSPTTSKGAFMSAVTWGNDRSDQVYAAAVDASGNLYVTGRFTGTLKLGNDSLVSKGVDDMFVASFTSAGAARWAKSYGTTGANETGAALVISATSQIYVAGRLKNGPDALALLVGYDAAGNTKMYKSFGGSSSGSGMGRAVTVDGAGNVYLAGTIFGTIDFGGGARSSGSGGTDDSFVASFTPTGTHRWSLVTGSNNGHDAPHAIAADGAGNVYLVGDFHASADFGGQVHTTKGSADGYLASFDAAGKHRWSTGLGGPFSDSAHGVAVDLCGNVYVTGAVRGPATIANTTIPASSSDDVYVARYSSTGASGWAVSFGGSHNDTGTSVAVDGNGDVYVAGEFVDAMTVGAQALSTGGGYDAFVASVSPSGTHRWAKAIGGVGSDSAWAVAIGPAGGVHVGGHFRETVNFGGGPRIATGSEDGFVVKLSP